MPAADISELLLRFFLSTSMLFWCTFPVQLVSQLQALAHFAEVVARSVVFYIAACN